MPFPIWQLPIGNGGVSCGARDAARRADEHASMARDLPSTPAVPLAGAGLPADEEPVEGVVATYGTVLEAELARGRLEAAGLDARVLDAHTIGVAQMLSVAVGGVKVVVATEDLEEARELLARPAVVEDVDSADAVGPSLRDEADDGAAPSPDGGRARALLVVGAAAIAIGACVLAALF
jgi:hypothetical protein